MSSDTHEDLDVPRLRAASGLGHVEHHAVIASTNDRARQLAAEIIGPAAALVVADQQTAGRGRGGNRWWTGTGSLAFSLAIDPAAHGVRRESLSLVSLAAALAIVDVLGELAVPPPFGLHWPNDVFAGHRKLAGILVEALPDGRQIIGIGLNVNNRVDAAPDDVRARAVSLVELTGRKQGRTDVLLALVARFWPWLVRLAAEPAAVAQAADRACLKHGRRLRIESGNRRAQGHCLGIADDGALLLDTAAGVERFYSGVLLHD
jgi:BirA family biotin operon repressor/biotin-[acetyl-CoA-carboxylase] ligase